MQLDAGGFREIRRMAGGRKAPEVGGSNAGLVNSILFVKKDVGVAGSLIGHSKHCGRAERGVPRPEGEAASDLHWCTDAGNASKNVPFCATVRVTLRLSKGGQVGSACLMEIRGSEITVAISRIKIPRARSKRRVCHDVPW